MDVDKFLVLGDNVRYVEVNKYIDKVEINFEGIFINTQYGECIHFDWKSLQKEGFLDDLYFEED